TSVGSMSSGTTHGAAVRPSGSRPGNRRSPSPGGRCGPHAKQVGNGGIGNPREDDAPSTASDHGTGGPRSTMGSATGSADATRTSPSYTSIVASRVRTSSGGASGGGGAGGH